LQPILVQCKLTLLRVDPSKFTLLLVYAGLDYTVAHYGIITSEPRLDCVLTFVNDGSPEAADGWAVGEVGGFEAYLLADEEEETAGAAAVYRQVGTSNIAAGCSLCCVSTKV
jgi:hypothetical protein